MLKQNDFTHYEVIGGLLLRPKNPFPKPERKEGSARVSLGGYEYFNLQASARFTHSLWNPEAVKGREEIPVEEVEIGYALPANEVKGLEAYEPTFHLEYPPQLKDILGDVPLQKCYRIIEAVSEPQTVTDNKPKYNCPKCDCPMYWIKSDSWRKCTCCSHLYQTPSGGVQDQIDKISENTTETLEAKLRNELTPLYSLATSFLAIDAIDSPELFKVIREQARQSLDSKGRIKELLTSIEDKYNVSQHQRNWINVSEQKPETGKRLRAIRTYGNGRMEEVHTFWVERTECFDDLLTDIITHWQYIDYPTL